MPAIAVIRQQRFLNIVIKIGSFLMWTAKGEWCENVALVLAVIFEIASLMLCSLVLS